MAAAALLLALQAATAPPAIISPVQPQPQPTVPVGPPPSAWLGGEWVVIHEDANVTISLDESATRRDGDRARLRVRALLAPTRHQGSRYGLAEFELNCPRHTVRGIELTEYDLAGAVTQHRGPDNTPEETLREEPWPEGDRASETFAAVCHRTDPAEGEE